MAKNKKKKRKVRYGRIAILVIGCIAILATFGFIVSFVLKFALSNFSYSSNSASTEENTIIKSSEKGIKFDRQDRIDAFQEENPDLSYEECVKRVYMNLDYEPYTHTQEVEDLDSYVMLVNKYNGLPSYYEPEDLTYITGDGEVREKVAKAFGDLEDACEDFGLGVSAWSAYRSYEYQNNLFTNGVADHGLEYAEKYWTHPGFSEHQTGLTIDVCLDGDISDLDAARSNSHYKEFLETLPTCGFILRYPDDKQEYTQIAPESWHIRYVGKKLATYLYKNNLCLDEYYGLVDAGLIEAVS